MFWLNIYRDFTPKNKDVLEFLLVFQQQCRQLTFLRQITLYKDGNFLFPKMATQGKCRELIDNFLKCSITANYENDASRCQAINQNIFRHLLWTLAHRELKIIIHNKGKTSSNVSWWYIQIYIYKTKQNLYCGYKFQPCRENQFKEIAAIQCSDSLSNPVCLNYLVDNLRRTIGKLSENTFLKYL